MLPAATSQPAATHPRNRRPIGPAIPPLVPTSIHRRSLTLAR
jgi:hypothetical protein